MKSVITLVVIIFTLFLTSFFLPKKTTLTIRNHTFAVELAKSIQQKTKGLGYRSLLNENTGMLFLFDAPQILNFWMKDMKFAIDIIFIQGNKIVTIYNSVPFPSPDTPLSHLPNYSSNEPADKVLEINAGISEKYGFEEGDEVVIR